MSSMFVRVNGLLRGRQWKKASGLHTMVVK